MSVISKSIFFKLTKSLNRLSCQYIIVQFEIVTCSLLGELIKVTIKMNEADIGMMASVNTNKLSLLKLKSFNLWFTENTLNVFMEIDV